MARAFTPKVVTANRLLEGDAVWLTANGHWSGDIKDAELITDEATADLRLMDADTQAHIIAGAYLADAVAGDAGQSLRIFVKSSARAGRPTTPMASK